MHHPHPHPPTDPVIDSILTRNEQWAAGLSRFNPDSFHHIAKGQQPKVLWLGCSDSRVPESVITASVQGDIFVHRNIANQFSANDPNATAAVQFAVQVLQVTHVFVVGHTHCGGVAAALEAASGEKPLHGALGAWLAHLTHLARKHRDSTEIAEVNVVSMMDRLRQYINALGAGSGAGAAGDPNPPSHLVTVVGLIFELETGKLRRVGHRDAHAPTAAPEAEEEETTVH